MPSNGSGADLAFVRPALIRWALKRSGLQAHQAGEFLRGADGWLIAHALETHGFVVTEENVRHNVSRIKIPTVAKALSAPWKNTVDMCKELGAAF
jgi:Domain of unknown function (DUF4411)